MTVYLYFIYLPIVHTKFRTLTLAFRQCPGWSWSWTLLAVLTGKVTGEVPDTSMCSQSRGCETGRQICCEQASLSQFSTLVIFAYIFSFLADETWWFLTEMSHCYSYSLLQPAVLLHPLIHCSIPKVQKIFYHRSSLMWRLRKYCLFQFSIFNKLTWMNYDMMTITGKKSHVWSLPMPSVKLKIIVLICIKITEILSHCYCFCKLITQEANVSGRHTLKEDIKT